MKARSSAARVPRGDDVAAAAGERAELDPVAADDHLGLADRADVDLLVVGIDDERRLALEGGTSVDEEDIRAADVHVDYSGDPIAGTRFVGEVLWLRRDHDEAVLMDEALGRLVENPERARRRARRFDPPGRAAAALDVTLAAPTENISPDGMRSSTSVATRRLSVVPLRTRTSSSAIPARSMHVST